MPKFDPKNRDDEDKPDKDALVIPSQWVEPRCHVCTSDFRRAIDKMIAMGMGATEISRTFGGIIDRRSITNHAIKHLNYQEAAIRRIIEDETLKAQEDAEEGIKGMTKRKVYLEAVLHKAMEQLLGDEVVVEVRDAVSVIDTLSKFDQHTESLQLEIIKDQFNAFLQAIKEIAGQRGDKTLGTEIFSRSREILSAQGSTAQLNPPE